MEAVIHIGQESNKHLREFAEKHVDFVIHELRSFNADELKTLLRIFREENRTFEQTAGHAYNESNKGNGTG